WLLRGAMFGSSNATCLFIVDPHRDHSPEFLARVHKLIEPTLPPFLQMRIDPSFDEDHAVSLHVMPTNSSWANATHFLVSHYVADRNIGYSLPQYHKGKEEKVSVTVTTAEIPQALAKRVYEAWRKMLSRAAKSEPELLRVDPTTAEFSCRDSHGSHYARAYEPYECDDSFLLAQLGRGLIGCCHPERYKRAAMLKLVEKRTRDVEDFLKRHAHD
ncbi:MAG: hypothetical protein ACXWG0_01305, partial [Chthoniobacterales bacterium]